MLPCGRLHVFVKISKLNIKIYLLLEYNESCKFNIKNVFSYQTQVAYVIVLFRRSLYSRVAKLFCHHFVLDEAQISLLNSFI